MQNPVPRSAVIAVLVVAVAPQRAPAQQSLQGALHDQLQAQLNRIAENLDGVMAYAIKDLTTGETFLRLPDTVFPQASSIKLTILLDLMRQAQDGKVLLEEKHTVRRSEAPPGDRDPILGMVGDGTVTMSLRDLAVFMIVLSDNTATNILIDRLGMENINAGIARLGLKETKLRRRMIDLEAAKRRNENVSTPREMLALLEKVRGGQALDAAHTREFFSILILNKDSAFHKALPETAVIADKPGELEAVRCDSGIIELPGRPFILCVMTTYLKNNEDGERAIREVARLTYEYFERLARASEFGRVIK
ncbi:MAG: serine hydrolase [Terriglobia bacterium]